jgi:hypothetical protein
MGTVLTSKRRPPTLPARAVPRALARAAGLLKGKLRKTPLQYQRSLRSKW